MTEEMPYLRVFCDEVCARSNFIATNVWQKRYSRENREAIGDVHEYVIVYAKDPQAFKETRNRVPSDETERTDIQKSQTKIRRGRWRGIPMTAQGYRQNQMIKSRRRAVPCIVHPKGVAGIRRKKISKLLAQDRIYFGKDNNAQPNIIRYLSEVDGFVPWTWWPHDEVGTHG